MFTKKRSSTFAIALLAFFALFIPGMSAANASGTTKSSEDTGITLSADEQQQLEEFFTEYGVSVPTQKKLLKSYENGILWDSFLGVDPVSEITQSTLNGEVTIYTYPDGSIAVSDVSTPKEPTKARAVAACTNAGGTAHTTKYSNCRADVNLGVVRMGFYFNYTKFRGGSGEVTKYWGRFHHIVGGDLSGHRLERYSKKTVRYSADFSAAFKGFPLGWTAWMQVSINSKGNPFTTNN